jgi:hypothetical protein
MPKKFSPSEVEAIFLKAAALDMQLKDALSIEQLHEIALEAGISAEALELAIEELETQQLGSKAQLKEQSYELEAPSANQKPSLRNQPYRSMILVIGTFLAGRLGIFLLHSVSPVHVLLIGQLFSIKVFIGFIAYILELGLELVTFLAALSFPLVLATNLLKTNPQISDNKVKI